MDLTAERVAENEARFRAANERIEVAAAALDRHENVPFICECGRPRCTTIVPLSLAEYESVRTSSVRFFVAAGHAMEEDDEGTPIGVVKAENERFTTIDKVGVAGEVAAARDPRASRTDDLDVEASG